MAKRFRLRELEQEWDEPLNNLIPRLLAQHKGQQTVVARELGVSQASVSGWLRKNGYRQVVSWQKQERAS